MTDPFFPSISPRIGFPLLFAAQANKEVFVNEALSRADALLHCAIEGWASSPPAAPAGGDTWAIGSGATGEWAGKDGQLASFEGGNWLYTAPIDGMRVLDRASGQFISFRGGWNMPAAPVEPTGGAIVDAEARTAIAEIVAVLRLAGIVPAV